MSASAGCRRFRGVAGCAAVAVAAAAGIAVLAGLALPREEAAYAAGHAPTTFTVAALREDARRCCDRVGCACSTAPAPGAPLCTAALANLSAGACDGGPACCRTTCGTCWQTCWNTCCSTCTRTISSCGKGGCTSRTSSYACSCHPCNAYPCAPYACGCVCADAVLGQACATACGTCRTLVATLLYAPAGGGATPLALSQLIYTLPTVTGANGTGTSASASASANASANASTGTGTSASGMVAVVRTATCGRDDAACAAAFNATFPLGARFVGTYSTADPQDVAFKPAAEFAPSTGVVAGIACLAAALAAALVAAAVGARGACAQPASVTGSNAWAQPASAAGTSKPWAQPASNGNGNGALRVWERPVSTARNDAPYQEYARRASVAGYDGALRTWPQPASAACNDNDGALNDAPYHPGYDDGPPPWARHSKV